MTLKRHITLLLLTIAPFFASSQTYGNEWIDYSQTYYSFQIVEDGIYKLDYAALSASGVPLASFQSENIQIFGKEREIPIHVEDGGDSSIDPGDYVLFYAERNDGWLDSTIFLDSSTIGNPAYSLYNDTLLYFFTWNTSTNNLRYVVESDVNFGAYPSIADYIIHKHVSSYSSEYHEGVKESDASSSFFTAGEGWGKTKLNGASGIGITVNLTASTSFPYTGPGAPDATFTGLSVSASNASYNNAFNANHHLRWKVGTSLTVLQDVMWKGYDQNICNASFSSTLLSNGNTPIKFEIVNDLNAATDYQAYQYFSVEYPRQPNFNGASAFNFDVVNDPQGKIRLDISTAGYNLPIMLVHGDVPRIVPFVPNGLVHSVLIPNSSNGSNQSVIYKDSSMIMNVTSLVAVNGSGTFTDYSTANLENALIMIYHPDMQSASFNYRDYRASVAGSNYDPLMGDVEELYLQFGGGVRKHINGIRRFAHYVYNNSTQKPVGLFLMGKGIREADFNITTSDGPGTRTDTVRFAESLIPSFGQPSSDVCITAGLEGDTLWLPLMPTGRISARSNTELQDYLDKVLDYEIAQDPNSVYDTPNKDWQKHVLHFAGGSDLTEQALFQSYMDALESKISDTLFGAEVHQVYKSSSNPLDPTVLADVTDRISQGVSLMSYFGHASGTSSGFEINLDDPANWNNQGRYPVMLVNSCYNGNIFQQTYSKSEEFVQVANYGAIGYIASVGLGFSNYLNLYSQNLYTRFGNSEYGSTLGSMMKSNLAVMYAFGPTTLKIETTATQMVLNGDPMLRLNTHEKPEIEITPQSVTFLPTNLDLTVDSIEMIIDLKNIGHSVTDTFQLVVERNFPNSSIDSVYIFSIPGLDYMTTRSFKMPLQPNIAIGNNIFSIRVDIPSLVDEQYDEINNNQLISTLFINIDGITPVIPYEFAVVPDDSVTLIASTTDPIADFNTYRFEIDTVDFEGTVPQSDEYRYALVSGFGGAKEVHPSDWLSVATNDTMPLVCGDSVVYFWRVSIAGDTTWQESSFQHIEGKTGWGQDHFYQFKKNGFYNVAYNRPDRKREFEPMVRELQVDVNSATWAPDIYYNAYYIGGELQTYAVGMSLAPKFHVVVIDPVTLEPWETKFGGENLDHDFGNNNNEAWFAWKYFTFLQHDPVQLDSMQSMVTGNRVPDGHYVLIYTPMTTNYDTINYLDSVDFYNTFAAMGSDSIVPGLPNRPFAFFTVKGDTSSVVEELTQIQGGEIQLIADLIGADNSGQEQSTLIGPSTNWGNVYWKQDPEEVATTDSTRLIINGYDINGALQMTIDTLFTSNDSILNLNTVVDANLYPYIDLSASYLDTADFTPAQIDRWHVLFSPLPEAAIDGTTEHTWSILSDTLEEGEDVQFAVDVRNIFNIDMDSLLITYWVEDADHNKHYITYPRQDSLLVGETLRDTISFNTVGLGGINSFWMEVNPYINGSFFVTDQPEQQHFNNLLQIPFFVNPDQVNPILDVTFNGNHILDGDIIDPTSEILITLKDDNEFLIMDDISDTTLFGVYLTDPNGNQVRIPFEDASTGETVMQWIPANPSNKRFKILWPAEFDTDGTYTLFVQGADRSGNISGDIEYKISFDIVHASTITRMMNYPNPFSTSTRFVFTLTGSEVPDEVIIQIMTITGKVVREITEDQLGLIQIGRNITEYAWDGTDEFGDPLANGVYLYRVKAQINGEDIEHRDSGADQYFKKDFGKMYLLR